jgi:hypothetical protein
MVYGVAMTYQFILISPDAMAFESFNTVILVEVNLVRRRGEKEWLKELVWKTK